MATKYPYKVHLLLNTKGAVTEHLCDSDYDTLKDAQAYINEQIKETMDNLDNSGESYTVSCIAHKNAYDIPRAYQSTMTPIGWMMVSMLAYGFPPKKRNSSSTIPMD